MKLIEKGVDYIIDSSIWVSLSVYALAYITYLNLQMPKSETVLYLSFFGTVFGYNFVKYFKLLKGEHLKFKVSGFKFMLFATVVSLVLSIYFFFKLKFNTQLFLIVPLLLTVFYTVSFGRKTLRTQHGFKIYVIALCWVFVTVFLPVLEADVVIWGDAIIEAIQRLIFVIVITLPFEIRDIKNDDPSLGTIPQKIGVKATKILGVSLLFLFMVLSFFKDTITEKSIAVLFVITVFTIVLLLKSREQQWKYYSSFIVEGIPLVWWLLLLL